VGETLEINGSVTPGNFEVSPLEAINIFSTVGTSTHSIQTYATRLLQGVGTGTIIDPIYVDSESIVVPNFPQTTGVNFMASSPTVALTTATKVTLFYTYGVTGITETWYSNAGDYNTLAKTISTYMTVRMGLATQDFKFNYARMSYPAAARKVDFLLPSFASYTGPLNGVWSSLSTGIKSDGSASTPDESALLLRLKLPQQTSARIFLHGFPAQVVSEGNYYPTNLANWVPNVSVFINQLIVNSSILHQVYVPVAFPSGVSNQVGTYTGIFPRGNIVSPSQPNASLAVGQIATFQQLGSQIVGWKGKKRVTQVATGGASFNIGGASWVGGITVPPGGNPTYSLSTPQYLGVAYGAIERATEHHVGRPFGQYPGRKKSTLSLRR
jgi:hypothetical protein